MIAQQSPSGPPTYARTAHGVHQRWLTRHPPHRALTRRVRSALPGRFSWTRTPDRASDGVVLSRRRAEVSPHGTMRCGAVHLPLKTGDEVEVIGMAPEEDCEHEMFVIWSMLVPVAQIERG